MNQFIYLTLFIGFLNFCSCATFIDLNARHIDHPEKCYDSFTQHIFSPGETYKPIGRCLVLNCMRPGEVQGYSCGKVIMPDECKELEQDLTKPHPYCCEQFSCPDENGKEFIFNPSVPSKLNKVLNERNDNYL